MEPDADPIRQALNEFEAAFSEAVKTQDPVRFLTSFLLTLRDEAVEVLNAVA
jgi:hypothetical protein